MHVDKYKVWTESKEDDFVEMTKESSRHQGRERHFIYTMKTQNCNHSVHYNHYSQYSM